MRVVIASWLAVKYASRLLVSSAVYRLPSLDVVEVFRGFQYVIWNELTLSRGVN